MLKYMPRLMLAVASASLLPAALLCAQVPGRDLLSFPIGALAEAEALSTGLGDGLRNPATANIDGVERFRFGIGALATGPEQGLAAQHLAAAVSLRGYTGSISILRAAVDGLIRTDSDPSTRGMITYDTYVISAAVARRETRHVVEGIALRTRIGTVDTETRSTVGIDGGIVLDRLAGVDGRVALSTFLWAPAGVNRERVTWNSAADLRLAGRDTIRQVRAGLSWTTTRDYGDERFIFGQARFLAAEVRGGVGRVSAFDSEGWRTRLGFALHYGRYAFALSREESGADLAPSYQFALTTALR